MMAFYPVFSAGVTTVIPLLRAMPVAFGVNPKPPNLSWSVTSRRAVCHGAGGPRGPYTLPDKWTPLPVKSMGLQMDTLRSVSKM